MIFLLECFFADVVAFTMMDTAKSHPHDAQAWHFFAIYSHTGAAAFTVMEVRRLSADSAPLVFEAQIQIPPDVVRAVEQQIHTGHFIAQAEINQIGDIFPGG